MKKISILLTLSLIFAVKVTLFAQMGGNTPGPETKRNLEKELKAIEQDVDKNNPKSAKSIVKPATWIKRGEIYNAIYKDKSARNLAADPLTESFNSYKEAISLDSKDRSSGAIKTGLLLLATDLYQQAIEAYNKEDFNKGTISFEQYLEINQMPLVAKDNPNYVQCRVVRLQKFELGQSYQVFFRRPEVRVQRRKYCGPDQNCLSGKKGYGCCRESPSGNFRKTSQQ
jgi:hypothetical protein